MLELAGLIPLQEAIEFSREDLSNAYDKSTQRIQGFSMNMIEQAIREGRAIGISYKSTDMPVTKFRVVLPVTVGNYKTKSGVPLKLSALHLGGQSERAAQRTKTRSQETSGEWRLFDLAPKSFKGMWLTDKFFYEYPEGYKRNDSRFQSIFKDYDVTVAEIERDAREGRGEKPGEPIDLSKVRTTGEPPIAPETLPTQPTQEVPKEPEVQAPEASIENPMTERERHAAYLKKPWNKFLRDGFKF